MQTIELEPFLKFRMVVIILVHSAQFLLLVVQAEAWKLINVIEEFKKLLDAGYREIILTGVNVGDYGKNIDTNLFNLLSELIKH